MAGAKCIISIRSTVDISVWTVPDAKGSILSTPYVADDMKQVSRSRTQLETGRKLKLALAPPSDACSASMSSSLVKMDGLYLRHPDCDSPSWLLLLDRDILLECGAADRGR